MSNNTEKTYRLHFKLTKHKNERGFVCIVTAKPGDLQGIKEERAMYFENLYDTPVKCVKVEEAK